MPPPGSGVPRPGFELPLLLAGTFRELIDSLHAELGQRGHGQARPIHGFALQAIGADGVTVSELGRRLGVTKQAAAKTAAALEEIGYITRRPSTDDARATVLTRTPRGEEMLELSAAIFERLRQDWVRRLGAEQIQAIEDGLAAIVTGSGGTKIGDLPGWLR
jgi:DNA-binding MarR family transcriptional regulator